jgi:hypothetical protein
MLAKKLKNPATTTVNTQPIKKMLLSIHPDLISQITSAIKFQYIVYGLYVELLEKILGHNLTPRQSALVGALCSGSLAMTSGNVGIILHQF